MKVDRCSFVEIAGRPELKTADFQPKLAQRDGQPFAREASTPLPPLSKRLASFRTYASRSSLVPPSQTVGSSAKVKYSLEDGVPTLTKLPEVNSIDDHDGKPVNIYLHIGQKPILAFGNSDGDQQMLEYVTAGGGPSLGLIVHHDDAEREVAYDRDSKIGTLDTAWDEAVQKGWIVVSMKDDWGTVFPFEE